MVLTLVVTAAFILSLTVSCNPINSYWNRVDPEWRENHSFKCGNDGLMILALNTLWIIVDLAMALLPMNLVWNLQMPKSHKISLSALFSLAFLPSVAASCRSWALYRLWYHDWDITCKACT